jgi:viroplasmin and RNaseH domain-containing protein
MKKFDSYEEKKNELSEENNSVGLQNTQYICKIIEAVDYPDKEHLKIKFDICGLKHLPEILKINKIINNNQEFTNKIKGRLKEQDDDGMYGYFYKGMEKFDEWSWKGYVDKYYTEAAQDFFTRFMIVIERSNDGFVWKWIENSLKGKFFVANFGENEYKGKVYQKCQEERSLISYVEGRVKDLKLKEEKNESTNTKKNDDTDTGNFNDIEDDLPF